MFSFSKSPIWQLIVVSDWVSKYVIILGLFILSIVCVAIIIHKAIDFFHQKRRMSALMKRCKTITSLSDLAVVSSSFTDSIGGLFLTQALETLKNVINQKRSEKQDITLTQKDIDYLALTLEQDASQFVAELESYLPVLSISASVSPLLGLFGTIWGLINAFINISQEKSADIAAVAPGIAAALITTLAGLVVAIPALVFFNYFVNDLRKLEINLQDLQDRFMIIVQQNVVIK